MTLWRRDDDAPAAEAELEDIRKRVDRLGRDTLSLALQVDKASALRLLDGIASFRMDWPRRRHG